MKAEVKAQLSFSDKADAVALHTALREKLVDGLNLSGDRLLISFGEDGYISVECKLRYAETAMRDAALKQIRVASAKASRLRPGYIEAHICKHDEPGSCLAPTHLEEWK